MAFDPFFYLAFLGGLALGRVTSWRSPRIGQAALATVGVLIFFLGTLLGSAPGLNYFVVPLAFAFALVIVLLTLLVVRLLPYQPPARPSAVTSEHARFPISLIFLGILLIGFVVGRFVALPSGSALTYSLYVLVALVGFELTLKLEALRRVWVPLVASVTGAVAAALLFGWIPGIGFLASFSATLAFGWYSLAGPLATDRLGATLGLFVFLTNFLRENLTMLLAPVLGRRVHAEGLTAMGGATTMDTTLYFVTRYGDSDAGSLALANGVILTVAVSLLLPLVVGL